VPVPPRCQAHHEGVRVAKTCPRGTIYLQEDQEQQQ
jgi:hypothetical protein